jgi:hypothetical protein
VATEKVSLSLSSEAVKEARDRVGHRQLSAYVDSALRLKLQHDRLRGLLDEMDAQFGSVSERVTKEVLEEWPNAERPAGRRSRRG